MKKIKYTALCLITFALVNCGGEKNLESNNLEEYLDYDTLVGEILPDSTKAIDDAYQEKFDSLMHDTILINSKKYYIVEGDMLLNEYRYFQYKLKAIESKNRGEEGKLVSEVKNGKIVRWPEHYTIQYCISKNSFETPEMYNEVKENMRKATKEWEETCNVKFLYDEQKDAGNMVIPTDNITFVVLGYDSDNRFIASAFFPYYPVNERKILIDPSYFTSDFDKIGVLRHELGHVLGFRHEHIRSEAPLACQGESTNGTVNNTEYDPKSVMHYFCGGMGTIELKITDVDRLGAQKNYGPPIAH